MNALTNGRVRGRAGGGSAGLPFRPPTLSVADTARAARSPPPIANFHPRRHLNESGLTTKYIVTQRGQLQCFITVEICTLRATREQNHLTVTHKLSRVFFVETMKYVYITYEQAYKVV